MAHKPSSCPACGYTKRDAQIHGDHHLCKNAGKAPWEVRKKREQIPLPTNVQSTEDIPYGDGYGSGDE